ncbi:MAG: tRNA pseudouridine(38-40) synthase TruA [Desulforhopalus sp.]|nr:tRNA pseudouridine(38-40) synthase TruA [Desulforhopalus sp.]
MSSAGPSIRSGDVYAPRNIKLLIAYDGTDYSGWQRQKHTRTIQGEIEHLLVRMTGEDVLLNGAGRTDAGVHADGMVAHFTTNSQISCEEFQRGLNAMLPGAIRILSTEVVAASFHARFSAVGKEYQYEIYTGKIHPPRLRLHTLHVTCPLDLPAIKLCLAKLQGTHDFSSFENSGSRDKDASAGRGAVRTIHIARLLEESPDLIFLQFKGDGFLRNMIRNLVGTLLEVGKGKITSEEFAMVLAAKDRSTAGPTAPAHGLHLKKVLYE